MPPQSAKKLSFKSIAKKPVQKPVSSPAKKPTVERTAPLKTTLERPVLRAFECLVHLEVAKAALDKVGIFLGEDAERQQALKAQILEDLNQLHLTYKQYWKRVPVEPGE